MFFKHALIYMIIKRLDYMQHCDNSESFPFESLKGMKLLKLPGYQSYSSTAWFSDTSNRKYSDVWNTAVAAHTQEDVHTHKKSLSPQALSCKTCLLEMDLDTGALSVWIFSLNTRQFLQRTKPYRRSHAHLSCIVSKALLCSYSLSLI